MNDKDKSIMLQQYNHSDVSIVSSNIVHQGFFQVKEYTLQHALYSGKQSQPFSREIFERGNAVVVMPYDVKNDKLLFNEQFRPGALNGAESPWLIEFVAGMFGENESPIDVAIREAKEEANITLTPDNLTPIMEYFSSPGGTSECIHLYLARFNSEEIDDGAIFGLPEENEDIKLHLATRTQALELLAQGKIVNAATIIGLQWLALNYQLL